MVINVEYNQLDPLLRATGYPDGDVNCETGYSPFPGNINQVLFLTYTLVMFLVKYLHHISYVFLFFMFPEMFPVTEKRNVIYF